MPKRSPFTQGELWTMACALEEYGASGHPVGNVIFSAGVQLLGESWIEFKKFGSVHAVNNAEIGGLSGYVSLRGDNKKFHSIVLGSKRYLERHQVVACRTGEGHFDDEGTILVHAAVDGSYAGTFFLSVSQVHVVFDILDLSCGSYVKDAIRAEAVTSIQKLKGIGYGCGMVSTAQNPTYVCWS